MSERKAMVIFDDAKGMLGALTDLRPVFDVRTGALPTIDRLRLALGLEVVAAFVPVDLAPLTAEGQRISINALPPMPESGHVLLVNGRCVLPLDVMEELQPGQAAVEASSGDLICALLSPAEARQLLEGHDPTRERITVEDRVLLSRPWDVIRFRDQAIAIDLALLANMPRRDMSDYPWMRGEAPFSVHPSARIAAGVTFDLEHGPIIVDEHAVLRPGAVIIGPAYVGQGATVTEQATIRGNTAIGPTCKIGGEVAGTIVQGFSNKAHEGYVGDSWIGQWVNLGAGTTTSNLMNTYSEFAAIPQPGAGRERTGLMFLGGIFGDHTKTAIHTRVMGGSVIGTGTMWAASAALSGATPRFLWATDEGVRTYREGRFLESMDAMMARRQQHASEAYRQRILALHARHTND